MQPSMPPHVVGIEVVAAQPTEADSAAIAHLGAEARRPLPQVTYLVKVRLETIPPATSQGWALYVDDFRIPKYWEYKQGIYFKVFDSQFFDEHKGHKLRFSPNGSDFIETGIELAGPPAAAESKGAVRLPLQAEVLK